MFSKAIVSGDRGGREILLHCCPGRYKKNKQSFVILGFEIKFVYKSRRDRDSILMSVRMGR